MPNIITYTRELVWISRRTFRTISISVSGGLAAAARTFDKKTDSTGILVVLFFFNPFVEHNRHDIRRDDAPTGNNFGPVRYALGDGSGREGMYVCVVWCGVNGRKLRNVFCPTDGKRLTTA